MNLLVGFDSSEPIYAFSKFFNKVLNDEDLILDVVHCDPEDEYKKRFRIPGERLVNLKVRFIHFDRIEVYTPNLKSFFFHKVDFVHEFLEQTLSSLDHVDITLYGQDLILDVVHCDPEDEYKKRFRISGERLVNLKVRFIHFDRIEVYTPNLKSFFFHKVDFVHEFLEQTLSSLDHVDITLYGQGFEYLDDLRTHMSSLSSAVCVLLKTLVVEDGNVGDEVKNYFIRGRSGQDLILDVVHCDPEDEYKKRFRISGERLVNLKVRFIHFDRIEVYTPNLKSFFFHKVDFVHEFLEQTLSSLDHVDITLYGQGFEYLDDLRTHISSLSSAVCVLCEAYNTLKRVIEYVLSHGIENLSMNLLVGFDSSEPIYAFSKFFNKVLNDEDLIQDVVHCDPEDEYKKRFRISGERLVNLKVRFIHFDRIEVYTPNLKSFFFHKVDFVHEFLEQTLSSLDHVDITLYGQGFEYLDDLRTHISSLSSAILDYIPKFLQKQISPFTRLKTLVVEDGNVGDEVKNYFIRGRSGEVSEVVNVEIRDRVIEYVLSHGIENLSMNLLVGFDSSEPIYAFSKFFNKVLNDEDLILDVVHCDPEDEYKKRFRISGERLVNLKVRFIHFDRIEVYTPNLKSFFFHKVDFVHEFLELTLPSLDHVDITLYGQGFEYLDDLRTHISSLSSAILDYIPKFLQKQISPFTRLKTLVVEDGNVGDEVKNYIIRGRSGEVSEVVKVEIRDSGGTGIGCEAHNTLKRVIEYVLSHGIENLSMNLLVGFDSSEPIYAFSKFFNKVLNDEDLILDVVHCDPEDEYKKRFRISGERLVNLKVRFIHFDRIEVYTPNLKSFFFHKVDFVHEFLELTLPSLDHVDITLYDQDLILDVVHCDPEDEYKKRFKISGERLVNLKVRFIHFDRIEVYTPNLKSFFFHKVDFVHEFLELTLPSLDHVDITLYGQALDHSTTEILDYIPKFLQKQISPFTRLKTLVVEDGNVGDEVKNYFIRGRSGEVSEVVKWGTDIGCEAYNTLKRVIEYVLSHGIENLSMNLLVGFESSEPIYAFSKFFNKVLNDEDLILDVVHCDPEDEYKKRFRISGERLVNLKVRFIHFDRIEVYTPNLKSFFFHKVDFVHEFLELTLPSLDHVDITLYGQALDHSTTEILDYIPKFLQKQISPFTRLKTLVVEDGNVGDEVKNYFIRGRSGEVSEVVKWGTDIGCEAYNTLKRVIEYVLSHGIENLSMNLLVDFDSSEPVYAFSKLFSKVLNDEGMLILKLESMKLDQSFRLQTTGFRLLMKVELVECKYFYDEEVIKPFGGLLCLEDLILDVVHCDPEDEYKKRFRISGERLVNLKVRFIHFDRIEVYAPNLKSFFFHKVDFVHEFLELTLPSLDHVDIMLYGQGFEYLDDLRTHIITFFTDFDYILKFLQKQISPFTRLKTLVVEDVNVGDEVKNYFIRGRSGEVSEVVKIAE
ncbi:hypothetical protein LINPERPRIM_LOCUS36573 [Linum perenne]